MACSTGKVSSTDTLARTFFSPETVSSRFPFLMRIPVLIPAKFFRISIVCFFILHFPWGLMKDQMVALLYYKKTEMCQPYIRRMGLLWRSAFWVLSRSVLRTLAGVDDTRRQSMVQPSRYKSKRTSLVRRKFISTSLF